MKKIKWLIIFMSILFLSGCTVDYELQINTDLSLKEQATITESISYFETNYEHYYREEVLDALWERNIEKYKDLGYKYEHNSDKTGIFAHTEYISIEEYLNKSTIYKQYFENINYEVENNFVTIETTGAFYPYNKQDYEKFIIDQLQIIIKVPFKVIESNEDRKEGNRYIWTIDNETQDKEIKLTFDSSKESSKKEFSKIYIYILVVLGIVIIVGGIYAIYRVMRNNNHI